MWPFRNKILHIAHLIYALLTKTQKKTWLVTEPVAGLSVKEYMPHKCKEKKVVL